MKKTHVVINNQTLCPAKVVNGDPWLRFRYASPTEFRLMMDQFKCKTCDKALEKIVTN